MVVLPPVLMLDTWDVFVTVVASVLVLVMPTDTPTPATLFFSYAVADTPKSVMRPDSVTVLLPLDATILFYKNDKKFFEVTVLLPLDATILTSLAAEMLTDSSPLIWLPLTVTFELEDNWVFLPVKMLPFRPTE